ncbi:hypothetical protein [Galbibacter sp. PAP.153]|uniref:hypothetical protein n=1 Tax=Galbibacter sp. PAP.153 TaxID=3104623 RepID=UPI00300A807D
MPKQMLEGEVINPYFSNELTDYVYKVSISLQKQSFSGILILKKIDTNHHRVVFTTEMGNKIFDFSFFENDFKVNFILKKIDRKMLVNMLKNDFNTLTKEVNPVTGTYIKENTIVYQTNMYEKNHYYFIRNEQLIKIVKTVGRKEKTIFLFSKINNNIAQNIQILHNSLKLKINLTAL